MERDNNSPIGLYREVPPFYLPTKEEIAAGWDDARRVEKEASYDSWAFRAYVGYRSGDREFEALMADLPTYLYDFVNLSRAEKDRWFHAFYEVMAMLYRQAELAGYRITAPPLYPYYPM